MENVKLKVDGKKLTIEIDLEHRGEISKTGKSTRVASTEGWAKVDGTKVSISLNAVGPLEG